MVGEVDENPLGKKTKHKKTIELSALATTQTSVKTNAQFTMSVKGFHNSINNNNDRQAASQAYGRNIRHPKEENRNRKTTTGMRTQCFAIKRITGKC